MGLEFVLVGRRNCVLKRAVNYLPEWAVILLTRVGLEIIMSERPLKIVMPVRAMRNIPVGGVKEAISVECGK